MGNSRLRAFVAESNRIEGIERDPTDEEIDASSAVPSPISDEAVALGCKCPVRDKAIMEISQ